MNDDYERSCPAPSRATEWTELELLQRMLLREGRAWREFHTRYDRLIYRAIHKVTQRFSSVLSSADVDEIYALFMCSLNTRDMHKLRTFEPERGHRLSTWIGLLATNAAWDYLRSRGASAGARQCARGRRRELRQPRSVPRAGRQGRVDPRAATC